MSEQSENIAIFITKICIELKEKEGFEAVKRLLRFDSIRSMVLFGYKIATSEIGTIEQMNQEEKIKLWNESKEYVDQSKRIDWCRCVYYLRNV